MTGRPDDMYRKSEPCPYCKQEEGTAEIERLKANWSETRVTLHKCSIENMRLRQEDGRWKALYTQVAARSNSEISTLRAENEGHLQAISKAYGEETLLRSQLQEAVGALEKIANNDGSSAFQRAIARAALANIRDKGKE